MQVTPREKIIDFVRRRRGINLDGNKEFWRRIDYTPSGKFIYTSGETGCGETGREPVSENRVYELIKDKFSGKQAFSQTEIETDEQLLTYIEKFAYT